MMRQKKWVKKMNESNQKFERLIKGTAAQVEALTSTEPLTVVSAGAGTGKTQTLAQRFAWLLAREPDCRVDEILVLTFTKKAAREMQERIKGMLEKWYEAEPAELAHLKERAASLEEGYISTIHSFAMKLIRESGLVLDIDPTSTIMPAPKEDLWWQEYAALLSEARIEKTAQYLSEDWKARIKSFEAELKENELVNLINDFTPELIAEAAKSCSEKLYCAGITPEQLWEQDEATLLLSVASARQIYQQSFRLWLGSLLPQVAASVEFEKKGVFRDKLDLFIKRWQGTEETEENCRDFTEALLAELFDKLPTGALRTRLTELLGYELSEWREKTREQVALARMPEASELRLNRQLCRLCAAGWASWDSFRRRERLLTLSDLIFYASLVLRSSSDYKQKFRHILIDEFQDTDPLQDALVSSLWVSSDEETEKRNTLFIVGDEKQSIYRFRHADLTLFADYRKRCENNSAGTKYVALKENFRTASGLLEKFNEVFSEVWAGPEAAVKYEALIPPSESEFTEKRNSLEEPPFLEAIEAVSEYVDTKAEPGRKRLNAAELRQMLYTELGRRFNKMVSSGMKIWDKKEADFRPVRWRDLAVLVPSRAEYPAIESVFEQLKLPYLLSTSKNYFARGETGDLINLASMLAWPENPSWLAGFLSSPFSGLKIAETEELLAIANSRMKKGETLPLLSVVREKCPELSERIESLRRTGLLKGVSAVILELLKKPTFLESYSGLRRRRVNANIIYLAQLAEEYEASEGISLAGCAAWLLAADSSQGAKEEPDALDDDADAIRIMTVHASKGLEFPITALVCSESSSKFTDKILVSKKYGVLASKLPASLSGNEEKSTQGALWEKKEETEANSEERKRLWYVGFTRAQEKLILCSRKREPKPDSKSKGAPSFISELISRGLPDSHTVLKELPTELSYNKIIKKAESGSELTLKTVSPAKLGRLSASAYAMHCWCPAAYRMVYRQGRTLNWTVKGGEGRGADFGSLLHWILARWDFTLQGLEFFLPYEKSPRFTLVRNQLPPELRASYESRAGRKEAALLLRQFAESDEGRQFAILASEKQEKQEKLEQLQKAGKNSFYGSLRREMPFRVPVNGLILIGATDLYWEDEGGLHLRDWKSSREADAPSLYYENQLDFYAYAISRCRKEHGENWHNIDGSLLYLGTGEKEQKVKHYTEEELLLIEQKINYTAEAALKAERETAGSRCADCPWKLECEREIKRKSL